MARACLLLRGLLHRSRDGLSPAHRLELEAHLESCARCAADVDTIEAVRALIAELPLRPLGPQRIERAIDRAFDRASASDSRPVSKPRRWVIPAVALGVAGAAAALLLLASPAQTSATDRVIRGEVLVREKTLVAESAIESGVPVVSENASVLALGPARVELMARTELEWNGTDLAMRLERGGADMSIEARPDRPFRVITRAFILQVAGARFRVTTDSVTVFSGTVVLRDATGSDHTATLRRGQSWRVERRRSSNTARPERAAADQEPATSLAARHERRSPRNKQPAAAAASPSAIQWLARARRALASGDLGTARRAARAALSARPGRVTAAEARTILAECAQAAGHPGSAIRLYLDIARRYPDLRAAQTALFAAARLEANRGRPGRARILFRRYLKSYPAGPFAGDARSRLRSLGSSDHGKAR